MSSKLDLTVKLNSLVRDYLVKQRLFKTLETFEEDIKF
jgi:hypothetical protein